MATIFGKQVVSSIFIDTPPNGRWFYVDGEDVTGRITLDLPGTRDIEQVRLALRCREKVKVWPDDSLIMDREKSTYGWEKIVQEHCSTEELVFPTKGDSKPQKHFKTGKHELPFKITVPSGPIPEFTDLAPGYGIEWKLKATIIFKRQLPLFLANDITTKCNIPVCPRGSSSPSLKPSVTEIRRKVREEFSGQFSVSAVVTVPRGPVPQAPEPIGWRLEIEVEDAIAELVLKEITVTAVQCASRRASFTFWKHFRVERLEAKPRNIPETLVSQDYDLEVGPGYTDLSSLLSTVTIVPGIPGDVSGTFLRTSRDIDVELKFLHGGKEHSIHIPLSQVVIGSPSESLR